jgi:hypothetical protein
MTEAQHDDDRIVIRLRDVYHIAKRTEDKVDLLAYSVSEKLPDHESRLRSMEKRVWAIPSLSAIIAVISLLIALRPHGAPTVSSQSAPRANTNPTTISAPAPTTAPTVRVLVTRRSATTAAPTPTTTSPRTTTSTTLPPPSFVTTPTVPKPLTTLVARIENVTGITLPALTKEN